MDIAPTIPNNQIEELIEILESVTFSGAFLNTTPISDGASSRPASDPGCLGV
jgi:hypothetical protein